MVISWSAEVNCCSSPDRNRARKSPYSGSGTRDSQASTRLRFSALPRFPERFRNAKLLSVRRFLLRSVLRWFSKILVLGDLNTLYIMHAATVHPKIKGQKRFTVIVPQGERAEMAA